MKQLPGPPSANERALGSVYREEFTDLTTDTITLTYPVMQTVDGVALEQVFRNGKLLAATAVSASTETVAHYRESRTGSTSDTWVLSLEPDTGTELVFLNGALLDPATEYAIAGDTITLASAPVNSDLLIAWYPVTTTTSGSAGTSYTIDGSVLTLDDPLVATDVLIVHYSYRTN